ncbi:MAG: hypothetical protein AAF545_04730 [Pseudomonadota bacterium]
MSNPLHLLRNALWSGTSPLARQLFDVCATVVVVVTAVGMGSRAMDVSIARSQIAEAASVTQGALLEAAVVYAETGQWPEPGAFDLGQPGAAGRYVSGVAFLEHGRVQYGFVSEAHPLVRDRQGTLAPHISGDHATLRWQLDPNSASLENAIDPRLLPYAWRLDHKEL